MGRPRQDNAELFTTGDLFAGTGISVRALQYLRDSGLMPEAIRPDESKRAANLYTVADAMHLAIVVAFQSAGLGLAASGRIALHLPANFTDFDFGYISRVTHLRPASLPADMPEKADVGFWLHHHLRRSGDPAYAPFQAWSDRSDDIRLLVADGQWAMFDRAQSRLGRSTFGDHAADTDIDPIGELLVAQGGAAAELVPIYDMPGVGDAGGATGAPRAVPGRPADGGRIDPRQRVAGRPQLLRPHS